MQLRSARATVRRHRYLDILKIYAQKSEVIKYFKYTFSQIVNQTIFITD